MVSSLVAILFVFSIHSLFKGDNNPWYLKKMNYHEFKCESNVVSIIDSGYNHIEGINEGQIVCRYNAINDSEDVTDNTGHGTSMISLMLGVENDAIRIKGLNPYALIIVIKVVDESGKANAENVAKAIRFSVDNGAQIVNLSLGSRMPNQTLKEAVEYAVDNGVYVVASSGDSNNDDVLYPAKYSQVIAVQAQDFDGKEYVLSNIAKGDSVLVPGVDVEIPLFDDILERWELKKESGSSISTIILSALISTYDLEFYDVDYEYIYSRNYVFLDYNKIMRRRGI